MPSLQEIMNRGVSETTEKNKQMIYTYREHQFENEECVKYSDVHLDPKLTCEPHINQQMSEIKYHNISH